MNMTGIIVLVVIVLLVVWCISIYNNLVKLRNNRENAFANIDVQLKQRHDLVPQLVGAVKGYADHEKDVFMRVTEARSAAMSATNIDDKIQAENALTSALSGLKVSLEAYPELKANENFLKLQDQLVDTEEKLQASRRFYNAGARDFNTRIIQFPVNIFFGSRFEKYTYFTVDENEKEKLDKAPNVEF